MRPILAPFITTLGPALLAFVIYRIVKTFKTRQEKPAPPLPNWVEVDSTDFARKSREALHVSIGQLMHMLVENWYRYNGDICMPDMGMIQKLANEMTTGKRKLA